jgi:hypothetical protein
MRTTPLRRTTLHLSQIFLTEGLTFIAVSTICAAAAAFTVGPLQRHLHAARAFWP